MSTCYFDSSGIVKRYIKETGSSWAIAVTDPTSGNEIFTSLMSGAEVVAAISKRGRTGSITPQDAMKAITAFKVEFRSIFVVLQISDQIVDHAMTLAEKHGLRGYDSVQLANAIKLHARLSLINGSSPLTFVSADDKLNAAAKAEGLLVENPNNHP